MLGKSHRTGLNKFRKVLSCVYFGGVDRVLTAMQDKSMLLLKL